MLRLAKAEAKQRDAALAAHLARAGEAEKMAQR
jgi:hypothetical protein